MVGTGMSEADHNSVAHSDYSRGSVGGLLSYIEREQGTTLRDRHGNEMDEKDIQQMIEKSEKHQMSRQIVISPENSEDLSRDELAEVGKKTLRETLGDREGVDYAYGVHMDGGDRPHVQAAATGRANSPGDPLWLDSDDLEQMRDIGHRKSQQVNKHISLKKVVKKTATKGLSRG